MLEWSPHRSHVFFQSPVVSRNTWDYPRPPVSDCPHSLLKETLTQYITFNRGGWVESVLLYSVVLQPWRPAWTPLCEDSDKSPELGPLLIFSISLVVRLTCFCTAVSWNCLPTHFIFTINIHVRNCHTTPSQQPTCAGISTCLPIPTLLSVLSLRFM